MVPRRNCGGGRWECDQRGPALQGLCLFGQAPVHRSSSARTLRAHASPGLSDHGNSSVLTALLQQCPPPGTGSLSLREVTWPLGAAMQPQAVCGESLKDEQGLGHTGKQRGRRERGGSHGQSCGPHSISQAGSGGSRRHRVEQERKGGDQESPELEKTSRVHPSHCREAHRGLETAPVYMHPESGGAEMRTQVYGSHPGLSLHHIERLLLQGRPGE